MSLKLISIVGFLSILGFLLLPTQVFATTVNIPVTFRSVDSCSSNNVSSSKFGIDNGCTFIAIGLPDFRSIPVDATINSVSMLYLNGSNLTPPYPGSNWPVAVYRSTNNTLGDTTTFSQVNTPNDFVEFGTDLIHNGDIIISTPEFQNIFNLNKGFIIKKTTSTDNEFLSSFYSFTLTVDYSANATPTPTPTLPLPVIGTFIKYPQNPVLQYGQNPSLIKEAGVYKMWYETNYGQGWRINYAYSSDGVHNWIVPYQTVLPVGTPDGFEMDTSNPYVLYDNSSNLYKMWYTGVNQNWASPIADRFRLGYATSLNGINWTKYGWVLKGTSDSWDAGGIARGESIMYKDGEYKMWYTATDTSVFHWQIGYATSQDGINWTKKNNGLPVISATEPWELNNAVQYPNVIFDNNKYEMFYTSNDLPTQIIYATSVDGIHWDKPAGKNPVLTGTPGGYDAAATTGPFAIRNNDGTTMLWYAGGVSYIMFATDGQFPVLPTPTPSPTPYPTPTPTPTPTPIPTTKIVVIPGMGASWNPDAILGCKTTNYVGTWRPIPHFGDMYNAVVSKLQKNGLTPHVFYYDWRQPMLTNGQLLAQFISTFTIPNERIDMLAHSMGGLVGSAYLEHTGTNNIIDRFLSVGTPYQGSILAYPAWSAGIVWDNDMMIRIASTLVLHFCSERSAKDNRTVLQTLIPSFQNILPTFPYLYKEHSTTPIPLTSMQTKNNWLPQHTLKSPFFGVTIGLLSGTGFNTLDSLVVRPPNIFEKYLGDWIDGAPVKKHISNNGDGTVLQSSVAIDGAANTTIHQTHSGLITSTQGIQNIVSFFTTAVLMQQNITQQTPSPDESALVIIGYPAHFTVTDPTGLVTNDSQNIVVLPNPKNGTHALRLNPSSDETRIIVAQFLTNGKTLWNEYKDKGRQSRSHKLFFDKDNPNKNPLQ